MADLLLVYTITKKTLFDYLEKSQNFLFFTTTFEEFL